MVKLCGVELLSEEDKRKKDIDDKFIRFIEIIRPKLTSSEIQLLAHFTIYLLDGDEDKIPQG